MKNFGQKKETTNCTKLKTVAHCREAREASSLDVTRYANKNEKEF